MHAVEVIGIAGKAQERCSHLLPGRPSGPPDPAGLGLMPPWRPQTGAPLPGPPKAAKMRFLPSSNFLMRVSWVCKMGHQGGEGCLGYAGAGLCNIWAGKHLCAQRALQDNTR